MTSDAVVLLAVLGTSGVAGIAIFFVPEDRHGLRTVLNVGAAVAKVALVIFLIAAVVQGASFEARFSFVSDAELVLRVDELALLFAALSATLWLVTTIYAVGYLEGSPNRSRFFGFFSLCVTATMGIALAGNLLTFILFYEMLTVATYPLVVHRGTAASLDAGRRYLLYTIPAGTVLLVAAAWLHSVAGPLVFEPGGTLEAAAGDSRWQLTCIFVLLVGSLGVKAALVPLHGWLPAAMVAPAPVSALLHAVAVVKAGAFGIIRVVHDVYGIDFADDLGVLPFLAVAASITIVYGSLRALAQDEIKRRLAFSTVSQLSYIVLGTALVGPVATTGAFVHLVHQGMMKITLFFSAGNLAETLGIHSIDEMDGVGRRMPITMAAFTLGGLGMIGLPPLAGFVSKWYLGLGALDAGDNWVLVVLATSSFLNAMYFLPPIYAAWFKEPKRPWPGDRRRSRWECSWLLLAPPLATALLSLAFGLFAGMPYSPLDLAERVAERMYVE